MGEADSILDYIVILILWSILTGPFVIALLLMLFAVVFILLSPVAALVSGVLAYRRGLNSFRYASVGLLYSVMLGFPWLFLTLGMIDRSLPRVIIRMLYFVTYAGWLVCILAVLFFALLVIGDGGSPAIGLLLVCCGIVSGVLWIYSLNRLSHIGVAGEEFSEERAFPYLWNTLPFACISVLMALPLTLLALVESGSLSVLVQELMILLEDMLD